MIGGVGRPEKKRADTFKLRNSLKPISYTNPKRKRGNDIGQMASSRNPRLRFEAVNFSD